ncbi:protein asteroid-like isoform X1 [Microplitis mediator]|uniref:protein asteroid-like isoform X1 n=1 Tax=Microplitis mediator TaxID=375433 RepID=UPI002554AA38|nr:protein asteroid-like isoform X1 [Microplitis mediator]
MGIRGLTTYVQNKSDYFFEPYELFNTKLVIDGWSLSAQLYCHATYSDSIFGGDYDQFAHCVTRFFEDLLRCNVTPLVILDGGWEDKKYNTLIIRFREKLRTASSMSFKIHERTIHFPLLLPDVFVDVMDKMEIKYFMCPFEADEAVAGISRALNWPLLSYDSDYYIYDVMYIPLSTLDPYIVRYAKGYVKKCKIYRVQKLLNKFHGLDVTSLPLASILMGNDYINNHVFDDFFFSQLRMPKQQVTNYRQLKIERIFNWLKHYTLNGAMNKIVQYLSKNQCEFVINQMEIVINSYLNISTHMLGPLGLNPEFIEDIEKNISIFKFEDEKSKLKNDSRDNSEDIDKDDDKEAYKILINAAEDEFAACVPKWFMENHSTGRLPIYFVNIITHRRYIMPVQIEVMDYPSAHDISMPIVKKICSLLTTVNDNIDKEDDVVIELITREDKEMRRVNLLVPKSTVTLENLRMLSEKERRNIIDETIEVEESYHLEELPSAWRLYVAVIIYWIKQNDEPVRSQLHLDCLLVSMFSGIIDKKLGFRRSKEKFQRKYADDLARIQEERRLRKLTADRESSILTNLINEISEEDCIAALPFFLEHFEVSKNLRVYPGNFDLNIVHVFSQFQSCLRHAMHLNALLGFIYERTSVSSFFNGMLLYNFYNNFKTRNDVERYVSTRLENAPGILKVFQLLRRKVIDILNSCQVEVHEGAKNVRRKKRRNKKNKTVENDDVDCLEDNSSNDADAHDYNDPNNSFSMLKIS